MRWFGLWRFCQLGVLLGLLAQGGLPARVAALTEAPKTPLRKAEPAINDEAKASLGKAAEFELKDQYDTSFSYRFPKSRITLLTFGDRKGSAQIEGWVRPLYDRYQERIEQYGVAVLSAVPGLLRGTVRGMFKNKVKYSVLLDWKGDVAKAYQYEGRQANVFLVDRQGRIVYRTKGPANESELQKLYAQIDALLNEGAQ